jgi:hypothetical protein
VFTDAFVGGEFGFIEVGDLFGQSRLHTLPFGQVLRVHPDLRRQPFALIALARQLIAQLFPFGLPIHALFEHALKPRITARRHFQQFSGGFIALALGCAQLTLQLPTPNTQDKEGEAISTGDEQRSGKGQERQSAYRFLLLLQVLTARLPHVALAFGVLLRAQLLVHRFQTLVQIRFVASAIAAADTQITSQQIRRMEYVEQSKESKDEST